MLCAISGEAPQNPVASRKSGNIFEKRLIEAYISENGKDPVTGEELEIEDLIDLNSGRTVIPRPPTLTSIPSLLSVFQAEWDALAVETYTLKQELTQTRQELATALYQHDAAVRVIARLSRERDEARDALSRVTVNGTGITNGEAMQVDGQGLSPELAAKVDATQEKLSKTRRKRSIPDDWVTPDAIQTFTVAKRSQPLKRGVKSIALDASGDVALLGGADGSGSVFSISNNEVSYTLEIGPGAITDVLWAHTRAVFATSKGNIEIFDRGSKAASFASHAGSATAVALHPSGEILASVGSDKSYILYDLPAGTQATQVYTDSPLTTATFHPDGHLFAAGGADGQIKLFDVRTGTNAANFDCGGSIQSVSFSENGTWLAASVKGQTSVSIWDLRKAAQVKVLDIGSFIESVRWDYTGQYLLVAGQSGLAIQHYSKSTKDWSEPLRTAVPSIGAEWGTNGQQLVSVDADGMITTLEPR